MNSVPCLDLVLAGGDDQDVAVGQGADLTTDLDPVQPWQPEVEDDDIGERTLAVSTACGPVCARLVS